MGFEKILIFLWEKNPPCQNSNHAVKTEHFKYEYFQILKFWEKSWEKKKLGEGRKIFHPSYHFSSVSTTTD